VDPASTEQDAQPGRDRIGSLRWTGSGWVAPAAAWVGFPAAALLAAALLPAPTSARAHYQAAALVLVTAVGLAWTLDHGDRRAHSAAAALTATFLPGLTLIVLNGTDWFFAGVVGDQSFRLEYTARFADDPTALTDYTYQGVPAFYSPGWFWTTGVLSNLLGTTPWQAYKWVAIASLWAASALTFVAWRATCSPRLAALLTVVTTIGLPSQSSAWLGSETLLSAGAYEPYAWLVASVTPPLLAWAATAEGPLSVRRGVGLGLVLGLAAWLYLLYAGLAVLALLLLTAVRRDAVRWLELVLAGVVSVVVVAPWLGRFALAWVGRGTPPSAAATYVNDASFGLLALRPSASPWFLLAALGAVVLLSLHHLDRRMGGVGSVVAAALVLTVTQLAVGQTGGGVLLHRLLPVLALALLTAGTLGVVLLARQHAAVRLGPRGTVRRRAASAGLLLVVGLGAAGHASEWVSSDLTRMAADQRYPDGRFPLTASREVRGAPRSAEPPMAAIVTTVERLAAEAGQDGNPVVLTDEVPLLALTPWYGYQQWWELYANPLGGYAERRAFLEGLTGESAPRIVDALRNAPDGPDVLVLHEEADALVYRSSTWDPLATETGTWEVRFPAEVLTEPDVFSRAVGPWRVVALRE
jgi:galactan 5-O-arabinofuranosyltransferase